MIIIWNMKETVITIGFGELNTVIKGLVLGLEDLKIRECEETMETTLLRLARKLREILLT